MKVLGDLDLGQVSKLVQAGFQMGTAFPLTPVDGQIFFRTDLEKLYCFVGPPTSAWIDLSEKNVDVANIIAAFLTTNFASTGAGGNVDGGLKVVFFEGATQKNAELHWDFTNKCWLAGYGTIIKKIARKHVHVQGPAATAWAVTHNLGTDAPLVQVYDALNSMVFPDTVQILTVDTLTITFTSGLAGKAVVVG